MNKAKVTLGCLGIFALLFGCSQVEGGTAKAGAKDAFEIVSQKQNGITTITKYQDTESGCYFVVAEKNDAISIEQVYRKGYGTPPSSVPDCED